MKKIYKRCKIPTSSFIIHLTQTCEGLFLQYARFSIFQFFQIPKIYIFFSDAKDILVPP